MVKWGYLTRTASRGHIVKYNIYLVVFLQKTHFVAAMLYDSNISLYTFSCFRKTSVNANDEAWHHICLSWKNIFGQWKFYKDGDLKQKGEDLKHGHTITQDGTMVLGQEQDSMGGGFQKDQSFQGMLSNANVWDRVLTDTEIEQMSKSCFWNKFNDGNVFNWVDFIREGGAFLIKPSPCEPFDINGRLSVNFIFSHQ